ncbi:MAG: peptide ABC transporter substrate-binding protein [Planctomycetota bacterium]
MQRVLIVFGLLIALLGGVIWTDRPLPPADLTLIIRLDYNTLDPQRMSYNHDIRLAYAIYEPLVRWDNLDPDFTIVPAAAERWEVSDDYRTYTFHIRENATWSNGEPLTAHDYAYAWQRAVMPDTAADYATLFFHIEGAEDFFEWRTAQLEAYGDLPASERTREAAIALREEANAHFDATVGLEAVSDKVLRVTLERPTPFFLDLTCFAIYSPVHRDTVERFVSVNAATGALQQDHGWTKPPNVVTNGPYRVERWRFKREMRLSANPHYWSEEFPREETVSILPIVDQNTGVLAFETGLSQWHTDVTVDYIADMIEKKQRGEYPAIQPMQAFGTYFWSFNCRERFNDGRPNPFHDARVRRAFAMSVDKDSIATNIKRSGEEPADVFIPPGSIAGFESPRGLSFDPERARAELEAAGWIDRNGDGVPENAAGEPFPVIELLGSTGSYHDDVGLALGRKWEETLGVRTKVVMKETKVYRQDLKKKDFMMARGGWFGDFGDPVTFLDLHKTGDGNNDRGYSDPAFDEMLERAQRETDPAKRMEILAEAERYTMEETLPILPIWHYNWFYMYHPPTNDNGTPNPGGLRYMSSHQRLVQYIWQVEVVREDENGGAS